MLLNRTAETYLKFFLSGRRQGCTAALLDAWRLRDLDGKPEGLTFTAQGRAIIGLDTRKPRRNLVLLEPAIAQLRASGQA
jgi:hypothetical protein